MSRPDIPVTISGDPKGFESAMARIRALTKTTAGDITASFLAIKSRIGGVAGLAAGIGLTATIGAVRDAAAAVATVGDEARKAGLSMKSFQELKFVAEQNRVGVDALIDGIKELNLRADEFIVTGGGSASDAFKRLGFDADSLKVKLKDPSALFTEIIGKLGQFDKAAQIRIADEVFGGSGGEQFVQLIAQGEEKLRETIKAAHDLGVVMNDDLIAKAAEIDRKFNLIASTVGTTLKSAIVSAASSLIEFIDGFRKFQDQMSVTLESKQADLGMRRLAVETKILEKKQEQRDETEKLSSVAKDLGFEDSKNSVVAGVTGQIKSLEEELAGIAEEEAKIVNVLNGRVDPMSQSGNDTWTPPKIEPTASRGGAAKAAKVEEAAYIGVIKALKEELELIGKSDVERDKMTALREAGVTASSKEGKEIEKLIELKYRQQAAEDELMSKREEAQQAAEDFGSTLDDQLSRVVDGTFEARDAVAALVNELINASTGGKGLFASLFGALSGGGSSAKLFSPDFTPNTTLGGILGYGGARAGGGDVSPGRIYRVNEYEDEFFSPGSHGRIVAPSKLRGGSSPDDEAGRSVIQISLSPELKAAILQEAQSQSIEVVKQNNAAQENYRTNGGTI